MDFIKHLYKFHLHVSEGWDTEAEHSDFIVPKGT